MRSGSTGPAEPEGAAEAGGPRSRRGSVMPVTATLVTVLVPVVLVVAAVLIATVVAARRPAVELTAAALARLAEDHRHRPRSWPCGCEYDPDLGWHECSHHRVVEGVRLTKAAGADPLDQPTDRTPPMEPWPTPAAARAAEPSLLDVQRRPRDGTRWVGSFDPPQRVRDRLRARRRRP